jgi:hypothetical protein
MPVVVEPASTRASTPSSFAKLAASSLIVQRSCQRIFIVWSWFAKPRRCVPVVIAGLIDVLPAEWRQMQRRCNCGVKSGFVWLCFMAMPGLTRVSISEKSLKALLLSEAGFREAGAA